MGVHILLNKNDQSELTNPISERSLSAIQEVIQDFDFTATELIAESQKLADKRFSMSPKEAGKFIENDFADYVFHSSPDDEDVDARYVLYKELSSFERNIIFGIGRAIGQSKI